MTIPEKIGVRVLVLIILYLVIVLLWICYSFAQGTVRKLKTKEKGPH